jgi:histidinol dehydrogenase
VSDARLIRSGTTEFFEFLDALDRRAAGGTPDVEARVRMIIDDVRSGGDSAVRKYTELFDGVRPRSLRIASETVVDALKSVKKPVVNAIQTAIERLTTFHSRQKEESWFFHDGGAMLGQVVRPIERVGVYVPGGKASYPSSVLMNVIPAKVAGVSEIVLCVPAPEGEVNPYVLVAAEMLGVKKIYGIGGAQAIAAMAYGTKSVPKVDKIVGPGNIYVATAKRMVFGAVDIDMIAGPSEILIIADKSADASFVAADMLGQAEHDELASSVLVTDSAVLAANVRKELSRRLAGLSRKSIAGKSIADYGAIVVAEDLEEAARIANRIAPEHLEVMTEHPMELLPRLRNAGAIFLGRWTPEALGDYVAGPNHTLPTGGTSRFFSPLGVYDFVKRSSLLSFDRETFNSLADAVTAIADVEGLEAHAASVRVRREQVGPGG